MGEAKPFKVTSDEELRFISYLLDERKFSPKTAEAYKEDVSEFLGFLSVINPPKEVGDVDPDLIRSYLLDLSNRGIEKSSLKRKLAALKHFYRFLFLKDIIKYDSFELVSSPKTEKRLPDFLTAPEIQQLFEANSKRTDELQPRDQALLELMFASGLRASEVVSLTLQQVKMQERYLRVFGKGKKERVVPFSRQAKEAMEQYLSTLRPKLISKCKKPGQGAYFFLDDRGEKLTNRGLEFIMSNIEKKTGVYMKLHPHKLRHSFATRMLSQGADLRTIQELMGHESIGTTQIYTHITYTEMKNVYDKAFPRAKIPDSHDDPNSDDKGNN